MQAHKAKIGVKPLQAGRQKTKGSGCHRVEHPYIVWQNMTSPASYPKIRLFVEQPLSPGRSVTLSDQHAHYLLHVMRVRPGEEVALFNSTEGEWRAEITGQSKREVFAQLKEQLRAHTPGPDAWLVFAPIKHERIDYIAEKATELGVSDIWPVFTKHTIVSRVNVDRLRSHAREAAEQCERVNVPELHEPRPLTTLLGAWPKDRRLFYGDESGRGQPPKAVLPTLSAQPWALLIGPEGGFSADELALLRSLPYTTALSLGPRIMRADTAAVAALACLQCWLGDWDDKPAFRTAS